MKNLTDKEFALLSEKEKVAYLNEHNYGEFRLLRNDEREKYSESTENHTFKPYAIREETNDVVGNYNTLGMFGKLSPRLFVSIKK